MMMIDCAEMRILSWLQHNTDLLFVLVKIFFTGISFPVLSVSATDIDLGENGTVRYRITGHGDEFAINTTSGEITTTKIKIDRELRDYYEIIVEAYDLGKIKFLSILIISGKKVSYLSMRINYHLQTLFDSCDNYPGKIFYCWSRRSIKSTVLFYLEYSTIEFLKQSYILPVFFFICDSTFKVKIKV